MSAAPLKVERLTAGYGQTQIVSEVSLEVPEGGRLAMLGRNGVGKTTLLAAIMGLCTHRSGAVWVGDTDISRLATSKRAVAGLGYVRQTRDIFRSLTVEENLITGSKLGGGAKLEEAYEIFPRLAERRRHLGMQLSGGEQQMLSIARTLMGRPSVLLLDEPLEGLAPVICDELMNTISGLSASRLMTVVLVEQQIERALEFAESGLIIERGRVVWRGQTSTLKSDRALVENFLGVGIR